MAAMNHDYAHCYDFTPKCPRSCFRAELERDLHKRRAEFVGVPISYMMLGGSEECPLTEEVDDGEIH